jgi:arginase
VPVEQAESVPIGPDRARYLPQIAASCERVAEWVSAAVKRESCPLVLGGDHSIAIGSVSGVSRVFHERGQRIGLIWIDAHPDMNTPETSPSGNIHGMPLACLIGEGPPELTDIGGFAPKVEPKNVVLVGIRDVDRLEAAYVGDSGATAYTMRDIDERGMRSVMEDAIRIASRGTAGFHLSLDLDSVDPGEAPGVGTPVPGGITYREAHLAMEMICDSGKMVAMDAVEVNPVIDVHNRTATLAVELILSAMGKRIL